MKLIKLIRNYRTAQVLLPTEVEALRTVEFFESVVEKPYPVVTEVERVVYRPAMEAKDRIVFQLKRLVPYESEPKVGEYVFMFRENGEPCAYVEYQSSDRIEGAKWWMNPWDESEMSIDFINQIIKEYGTQQHP